MKTDHSLMLTASIYSDGDIVVCSNEKMTELPPEAHIKMLDAIEEFVAKEKMKLKSEEGEAK